MTGSVNKGTLSTGRHVERYQPQMNKSPIMHLTFCYHWVGAWVLPGAIHSKDASWSENSLRRE